jgi:CheY-like chemotaxis protein
MRVLVVDDDSIHLLILKKIFEKAAAVVVLAKNGLEALKVLEHDSSFNVILTDIIMPQMDGMELLSEIKKSKTYSSIPVIGFTAGDVEYYRNSSANKFDILVPKPMNLLDLYELVKSKAIKDLN